MTEDFWNSKEISARYTSVRPLGSGGMGTVYLAKDNVLDKLVAIKVLDANLTPQQSIRFQREGKLSGKLKHENIVSVLDFGVSDKNVPYLVMEYLTGKNLGLLLKESGPLELSDALPIFIGICAGMIHSHANGISHRDLKPENIIITDSSNYSAAAVKIVDFGIARLTEGDGQLTETGAMLGSPLYMAPEQSCGTADERSDIYSLGCLMFKTLTGKPPFVAETPIEVVLQHRSQAPLSMGEAGNRLFPEEAENIVEKCLRKNPDDRFQSFQKLGQELAQLETAVRAAIAQNQQRKDEAAPDTLPRFSFGQNVLTRRSITIVSTLLGLIAVTLACMVWSKLGSSSDSSTETTEVNRTSKKKKHKGPELDFDRPPEVPNTDENSLIQPFVAGTENGALIVQSRLSSLTDQDLPRLSQYSKISKLILKRTKVTGTGFKHWKAPHITALFLDGSPVTYEGLQTIRGIPGLQALSLREVYLTPECLHLLATGSNLSSLFFSNDFSERQLTEECLSSLSDSKTLAALEIGKMNISAKGLERLFAIKNLRYLKLRAGELTEDAWQRLMKPNKLKIISFLDDDISSDKINKIMKIAVPQLGFEAVTMAPDVLKKLKGNRRILFLEITSPGITETEIREIKDSFPDHPEFGIDPESLDGILKDTLQHGELKL